MGAKVSGGAGQRILIVAAVVFAAVVLSVALVIGYGYWAVWQLTEHEDQQSIDVIEETFYDNRAGFEEQVSYITQLGQSERGVIAARWSSQMCFIDARGEEVCREATAIEEGLNRATPQSGVTVWQAKDDGRVFFMFVERPCYLMFDPQERNAKDFANEHGFGWERDLGDGWSMPCYIEDTDQRRAMWVHEVF